MFSIPVESRPEREKKKISRMCFYAYQLASENNILSMSIRKG